MSGNGADLGTVVAMLGDVLARQREHSQRFDVIDRKFESIDRKFAEVDRRLDELAGGLTDLRQAVGHYHASVLGHGILITELETRVRRLEAHLNLPPIATA